MKKLLSTSLLAITFATVSAQLNWTAQNTAFSAASTGINPIRIIDANNVWAVGYDGSGAAATLQTFTKTSNAGSTWTTGTIDVGDPTLMITDLSAISSTTAWVTATDPNGGYGGVWKTVNGGTTWTKQTTASYNTPADTFANIVHFWDANNGVTVGDPSGVLMEIYTTTNGGTNWTKLTTGVPPTIANEWGYVHLRAVAGNNIWCGTSRGRIFKSADKGFTWSVVTTPLSDFGGTASSGTIALKDANNAWILDNNGNVRATTNGGTSWTTVSTITQKNGIAFVPGSANTLIAVGNGTGSAISYNGGTTWTTIESTNALVSVAAFDNASVWGGSFNTSATVGGAFKLSTILATSEATLKDLGISVYPNPTTDFLNISSKTKISAAYIYDMAGAKIDAKISENKIDVSGLQSGNYVLSLNTDKGLVTKKFIKK